MKSMRKNHMREYSIYLVLAAEILVFTILSPNFFQLNNFMNILRQVSFVAIAAIGESIVLLVGGMDLSVGAQITLVNVLTAYLMVKLGVSWILASLIGIACATLIGYINGVIITKTKMPPMIATLAVMTSLQGIAYIISGGKSIYGFSKSFAVMGQGKLFGFLPVPVIIMAACLAIGWVLLNKTYFGRYFYAIGGNELSAKLSGIRVDRCKRAVYATCGFFTGLAGVLLLSRLNSGTPLTGDGYEFNIITAIVLGGISISGGRAKISNIVSGVLIIGVLETGFVLVNVGEYPQMVVKGIILLIAVAFDCMQRNKKRVR